MPVKKLLSLSEISKHWFIEGYPPLFHLGKNVAITSATGDNIHHFCTDLTSHAYIH